MIFKLKLFIITLLFGLGLELILLNSSFLFPILVALFLLAIFTGRKLGGKWIYSNLPMLFTLSSLGTLYLISTRLEEQIFIFLACAFYYLILLGIFRLRGYKFDKTARGMIMAGTTATIFFSFSVSYGLYLNFLIPLWVLMLDYFLITILMSFQYFSIIQEDSFKVWTYSFILSLAMMEIIWAMNYWPFGYLTTGVISLILYYVLWDLIQSYFLNLLSRKRVAVNMTFFSLIIIMVLLSAKWLPVV